MRYLLWMVVVCRVAWTTCECRPQGRFGIQGKVKFGLTLVTYYTHGQCDWGDEKRAIHVMNVPAMARVVRERWREERRCGW